jgi:hypothetical protein
MPLLAGEREQDIEHGRRQRDERVIDKIFSPAL